jgi:hypothetical protein
VLTDVQLYVVERKYGLPTAAAVDEKSEGYAAVWLEDKAIVGVVPTLLYFGGVAADSGNC